MKKIFLLVCLFAISITGIIQASNSTPIATRVYGDQFTPEINQTQLIGTAGVINDSFGSSGNIDLDGIGTQSFANAIQVLGDGSFLVLLCDGTNAYVAKFSENGVLQPSYSMITGLGFGTNGVYTISNVLSAPYNLSMVVDEQGKILVTAISSSNEPVIVRITSAGSLDSSFTFSDGANWNAINVLAFQSTGKIIAVGNKNTSNYGQIARYNFDGTLDITFGISGYAIFDGSNDQNLHAYSTVSTQLNTAYIDSSNNIYIPYANGSSSVSIIRLTTLGNVDTSWGSSGIVVLSYLANPNVAQICMAIDLHNNLVIATTDSGSGNMYITSIAASNGGAASPSFTNTTITGNFTLYSLLTTTDGTTGKILLIGSDINTITFRVTRLNNTGGIDTTFNPSFGYNEFSVGVSITSSNLYGASLSPNGTLYVSGDNIDSSVVQTPYVFNMYNQPYATQIARFPADTAQGVPNFSFGTSTTEAFAGVVSPINGLYGASLLQKPQAAIEITTGSTPAVGDILIGMSGLTNTSADSNMMLAWLTSTGAADTSVGSSANGLLTLNNTTASNEHVLSLLQGQAGSVYVAGYSDAGAILRAYSSSSTSTWTTGNASWSISSSDATTPGYQGIGVGSQAFTSSQRILLFVAESGTVGHISGYTTLGTLDTSTFNAGGSTPGEISSTEFGLHMGPAYGSLVNGHNEIFVAYKDSSTSTVTVAAFNPSGSGLVSGFGTSGVVSGLFGGITTIAANNIRVCFVNDNNYIIIAAVNGTGASSTLLFTCIDAITGQLITTFGTSGILTVPFTSATLLNLQQITSVSDGTVVATFWDNATDDTMYITRIIGTGLSAGTLDTTFNAQGAQPGVLPIKVGDKVTDYYARVLTSAFVQSTAGASQGNIIVAGYESIFSTDSTPMIMSVYGDPSTTEIPYYPVTETNIPGTLDVVYDLNTVLGFVGSGTAIFIYPSGSPYAGTMLVGFDDGTASKIARIYVSSITLDTTFGTGGVYTVTTPSSLSGINNINIDKNNNILISGVTDVSPTVWAQQLSPNGSSSISFTMPTNLTAIYGIYQQESGRYIVAASGTQNNPVSATQIGILVAFQDKLVSPATTFVVDPTFNPLGVGSVTAGQCSVGLTSGLYAIAINNNSSLNPDTIAVAYAVSGAVVLGVFTADGSGYSSTTFNTGGGGAPITTDISTDGSAFVELNIDASGNMIVAASYNSGGTHQVQVQRYSSAGVKDTTFNGGTGITTISNLGTSGVMLTDLLETTTGQTILVGYNLTGGNGRLFAARLDSTGALDATWNPTPSGTDTAGVLTYVADTATTMNDAAIAINGSLVSIGSTASNTSGDPIISIIFGDLYVTQVPQNPLESAAGTLDTTIPGSTLGALPLATLPAGGSITGVPQRLYIYNSTVNSSPNGTMLVASTDSTHVYITQLNADLSLNTNFGSGSGVISFTPNAVLSPTSVTVTDLYVANGVNDTTQPIYITGYTTTGGTNTAFGTRITSNGSSSTLAAPTSTLSLTGQIRQSTNSRILISGFNGTNGVVVAYNSAMTAIDTSFGNNSGVSPNYGSGYYTTSTGNPIYAMTTDNSDRIYIAYQTSSSNINVQRLLENGTALDTTFGTSGTFSMAGTNLSVTQIRMAIDLTNNQLVVAAQSGTGTGNNIQVNRYNISTNAATGSLSTITISGVVVNLADLFIDNDQNIYVVGYTGSGNSIVARVQSTSSTTILLDSTYAAAASPAGIANVSEGAMTVVTAGALDPDRRVYLVGSDGLTTGYMGRIFGDYYWTQISPAILQALVGTIDLTLKPNFTGGLVLSSLTGWSSLGTYTARAIIENPNGDGTSFILFSNNSNVIIGKLNADMVPVTAFGDSGSSNGLTAPQSMNSVANSITIDAFGNILVAGSIGSFPTSQLVYLYTSAGILNANFDTPSGPGNLASTIGTTVAQQKSGRYIVGGYDGISTGMISAYQNESAISGGVVPIDNTFGPAGNNGYYPTGVNIKINDLCINSNDEIYFVYSSGGTIFLGKLTANGSGLVNSQNSPTAFNGGAILNTGITGSGPRIAINSAGNILVGATTSLGVKTALYNGSTGAIIGSVQTIPTTTNSTFVLSKLVGSIAPTNEFYGSVNKSSTTTAIAFAITSAGILDTSFGISSNGILSTTVQSPVGINGISIQFDGKLVMVGSHNTPSTAAILLRGYGYPYISQYAQAPDQIGAGILDTTLWPSTGAFLLDNTTISGVAATTFNTLIAGYSVNRVYESGNGLMTFVANSGNSTVIFQFLKDLTLNPSFNSADTPGYRQFSSTYGNATGLFVDSLGNIFLTGNYAGASWSVGMTSTGTNLTPNFVSTASLASAYQISQQSLGRVIVAGQGSVTTGQANTDGYLVGYTNSGALDASFATGGQLDMGGANPITDITIDSSDNIIAVSNNSGVVVLQKVTAEGNTVTTLSGGTAITGAVGNVKVVLDVNGKIIVAAATSTGYAIRSYNNDATGTNYGGLVTITAGTTSVLSNIYATSDGKITLIGYDSATTGPTPGYAIVARLVSAATLSLDTSSFDMPTGYLVASVGSMNQFFDGIIHADDRIMLVGSNSSAAAPYMGRIFGDDYVTYVAQSGSQATPGTLNPGFGVNGTYDLSTLGSGALNNGMGEAIVALADGGYYLAIDNGINTLLVKTIASGALDITFNPSHLGGNPQGIAQDNAPTGVHSMFVDGSGRVVLVGTTGGAGWVQRYLAGDSGAIDTTFGTAGVINLASGTIATVAIEQTLARLVVAGSNALGNGALFAYTSLDPLTGTTGAVDTTFNAGSTPGSFTLGFSQPIYALIADQYDRLIFAVLNITGTAVDLYRLTPTGELDVTFGTNGKVANVISTPNSQTQVRVAFDVLGNIVIAASTVAGIAVVSYDNGTSTTTGANGQIYTNIFTITTLTSPSLAALVTSVDGYVLLLGNQAGGSSATSPTWVARLVSTTPGVSGGTYVLDSTNFNPNGLIFTESGSTSGGTAGIFEYYNSTIITSPYNVYNAFTVNANGTLGVLGYEVGVSSNIPTLLSVYDDPYTTQEVQSPDSKPVGTNDLTLGVSSTFATNKGVTFYGQSGNAASGQVARAIALYDDNNFVVALDGNTNIGSATPSSIMLEMFDTDGIANPNFGTNGSVIVDTVTYQNQFVKDMVTFTTTTGVQKAILAGYVTNSVPSITGSLIMQYILTPGSQALDTSFGGYDSNPQGVAFGDAQKAFVVGQQTLGRIIVGGISSNGLGLLLGYTANGNLDLTFANDGYQSVNTGTTGIYTHAIDTENRIVIAYNNAGTVEVARFLADGSGLDTTFTASPLISTVTSNSNIKVAVDSSNNVIVAAITNSGNTIALQSYSAAAGASISSATFVGTSLGGSGSSVYTIARLLIDLDSKVVVVATDSNPTPDQILIMRAVASGASYILDTATSSPFNVVGYLTYAVAAGNTQVATDAMIHPDGRIIVTGSKN